MADALAEQERSGNVDLHRAWILGLLSEYYDPMYVFQRESSAGVPQASRKALSAPTGCRTL